MPKWDDISDEYKRIAPRLAPLVPRLEYKYEYKNEDTLREYDSRITLEAILKLLWTASPVRKPLGRSPSLKKSYPSGTPLHRDLTYWAETGALEKILKRYFGKIRKAHLEAWLRRFDPKVRARGQHGWKPRQAGLRRNVYWQVIARKAAESVARKRGIPVAATKRG